CLEDAGAVHLRCHDALDVLHDKGNGLRFLEYVQLRSVQKVPVILFRLVACLSLVPRSADYRIGLTWRPPDHQALLGLLGIARELQSFPDAIDDFDSIVMRHLQVPSLLVGKRACFSDYVVRAICQSRKYVMPRRRADD